MRPTAGDPTSLARRSALLRRWGAAPTVVEELLRYNERAFVAPPEGLPSFPLKDGPQILAWQEYVESGGQLAVFEALRERLVQLRFPITKGISRSRAYLSATRKGLEPADISGLRLEAPQRLSLELHPTAVGRVPVLTAGTRDDFVALLRALAHRNEPVPIAESQGASLITGLNNWDRVRRYRREWEEGAVGRSASEWPDEMARMAAHKELYQDRIVLLSRGAYSDVPGEVVGMGEQEWLDASLVLRREHECAHLFTKHVFASARNNLMDELLADYVGIVAAAGCYRADWFLLFMGIEEGECRREGRLQNYLGEPPLSEAALRVLCRIVERAATNLEDFDRKRGARLRDLAGTARMIVALSGLTLEELASQDGERLLEKGSSAIDASPGDR